VLEAGSGTKFQLFPLFNIVGPFLGLRRNLGAHQSWSPECLESDCKGQSQMARKVLYTIGNIFKCRCLKWARITHLDIWNINGQKKGQKSNWQFDSQPLKVKNRPDFLACRWHATHRWKALEEGYNFVLDFISIESLHTRLWGPKVAGVPTLVISRLPLGSPGTKSHLDVGLMERHKIYYMGEGGGFPQVQAVVSLVRPSLPMARASTKSALTMH